MIKVKEIIFLFIVVFLLALSVEAGLRIWSHFTGKVLFSQLTMDDPILDWRLTPNRLQKNGKIHINSKGFRGPEFYNEKGDFIRITTIGDSCTFGAGSSSDEFTYPALLEKRLNSGSEKSSYEVINTGVPGYTSNQCLLYLKNELLKLRPDIIIVYCGWNDIWTYRNPYSNTAASPFLRKLSRSMSKSLAFVQFRSYILTPVKNKLYSLFRCKDFKGDRSINGQLKEKSLNIYEENLRSIIQIAKENGIKVLLITIPTAAREGLSNEILKGLSMTPSWREGYSGFIEMQTNINQRIRNLGDDGYVKIVDADRQFQKFSDREIAGLFSNLSHPNDRGYKVIADLVYTSLVSDLSNSKRIF